MRLWTLIVALLVGTSSWLATAPAQAQSSLSQATRVEIVPFGFVANRTPNREIFGTFSRSTYKGPVRHLSPLQLDGASIGNRLAGQQLEGSLEGDLLLGVPSIPLSASSLPGPRGVSIYLDDFFGMALTSHGKPLPGQGEGFGRGTLAIAFDAPQTMVAFRFGPVQFGQRLGSGQTEPRSLDESVVEVAAYDVTGLAIGRYMFSPQGLRSIGLRTLTNEAEIKGLTIRHTAPSGLVIDDLHFAPVAIETF